MRPTLAGLAALAAAILVAGPAGAITFGKPDGNLHPYVGALLADYDEESPGLDLLCSGTLIAPRVFQTAGHCTDFFASIGIEPADVWVTFDPAYDEDSAVNTVHRGTYTTHPDFGYSGPGGSSNPFDLAVVVLDAAPGPAPAELPRVGLLDGLKASGALKSRPFTAVGYGTVREDKRTGPNAFFFDGIRRYALQSYQSLQPAWLTLSMQPSTGDGGTCYGDSGGPHFLGGKTSRLLVSLTVTGDAMCRATDKTYRLDTTWARDFLEQFPGVAYPR
ncbi:MAG TPA: trypsin-like serine protease [Gaiellaceae bacterium]|nr:trypsin-like serine protease [Gaiellaceae bacterium]